MKLFQLWLMAGVCGLFLIVFSQNTGIVTFKLLLWDLSISKILVIPLILLTGIVIGFILGRNI